MTTAPTPDAPELQLPAPYTTATGFALYTADQMHQYARDYALSQTAGVADATKSVCDGCPHLKTEWWRDHLDNDETDSGTSATCTKEGRNITAYWHEGNKRPNWCPMLAAAPAASGGEEVSRTLPIDVRGQWYEVPIPVHLYVVSLREKLNNPATFFPDGTALANWLDSLHSTNDDGAATDEKWEPAQRAAAFLRGELTAPQPPAAASVSERARELLAAEYRTHGWHEDAGRLCMGGEVTSFVEDDAPRVIGRLIEQGDEDNHVITELGRLLAGIAVILKGPEPAGTAWSYHDLPELVASSLSEPRQVAAEMKAWAHTKMADQQSSRRDRMMVAEWAKRLLPESSFPVKDFDVEGMSVTKEAAREAVKRVALEQALTQQRGAVATVCHDTTLALVEPSANLEPGTKLYTTPQPSADAVRDGIRMDWLVSKAVEVRDPLRHGSRAMFHAQTVNDEDEPHRTTLREQVDAAMADELESLLARGAE